MTHIHRLLLYPPILNSSSMWASSRLQLEELYMSDWTGAVTTRTATILGFVEDARVHKHALVHSDTSINNYGYSPHPLSQYLTWIRSILTSSKARGSKPFIISIAPASVQELSEMLDSIQELRFMLNDTTEPEMSKIGIELNTSCPNIAGRPPPAYDLQSLAPLLAVFRARFEQDPTLTIGLKLAPYVHAGQFQQVVDLLASVSMVASDGEKTNCVSFLSCTNTIGSSVVFQDQVVPVGAGASSDWGTLEYAVPTITGGLGGEPIHALSLGNVYSFRKLLSEHADPSLRRICIIGIGGITSKEAVVRMRRVGASAVACATALGTHGVDVFQKLNEGLQ
ncbi:FMN-linked oxidoreductase [Gautieria morchelliformis]|nr:FMN-linked oxidoreductase [Gautieria morchelliformis]